MANCIIFLFVSLRIPSFTFSNIKEWWVLVSAWNIIGLACTHQESIIHSPFALGCLSNATCLLIKSHFGRNNFSFFSNTLCNIWMQSYLFNLMLFHGLSKTHFLCFFGWIWFEVGFSTNSLSLSFQHRPLLLHLDLASWYIFLLLH